MKTLVIYHRNDSAGYAVSNPGWSSGHARVARWLESNPTSSFEDYKRECSKYGISGYNQETFLEAAEIKPHPEESRLRALLERENFTCYPSILNLTRPTLCVRVFEGKQEVLTLIPVFFKGNIFDFEGSFILGNDALAIQNPFKSFRSLKQITDFFNAWGK